MGVVVAIVVVGFLVLLLVLGLRGYSRALLGPVDLHVSAEEVCMGDRLGFELALNPTGKVHVNRVTLECRGYEWIQWRETESYTDSDGRSQTRTVTRSKTHTLHEETQELASDRPLRAGTAFHESGHFDIPLEGPPSMAADDNAIRWKLELHVDILGLPDVKETYELAVKPARRVS
jgi:hypothetical protein